MLLHSHIPNVAIDYHLFHLPAPITMAAQRKSSPSSVMAKSSSNKTQQSSTKDEQIPSYAKQQHKQSLPPIGLQFSVLFCSGLLLVFGLRDFLTTGKNIAGVHDAAYLVRRCCCLYVCTFSSPSLTHKKCIHRISPKVPSGWTKHGDGRVHRAVLVLSRK